MHSLSCGFIFAGRPRPVQFRTVTAFRRQVNRAWATCPCHTFTTMLPVNTLRQVAELFPERADRLDDWQRGFCQEQISRFQKWGNEIHLSQKQAAALEKALASMQQKEGQQ